MERDGYPVTWQLNAIVYATACVYSEFQSKYIFFNLFFSSIFLFFVLYVISFLSETVTIFFSECSNSV